MKVYLICLMLVLGFVLTLHLSMNGQVFSILKNPRMANAIFWIIGALTAIIIGLTDWDPTVFARLKDVPIWLFTAGVMGGCLVFGISWTIPQLGAKNAFILLIAGQVITGMIFSHFGWLGSAVEPISWAKIGGVALMIGGVAVVTYK
jgi:transporter family-2 protein